MKVGHLMLAGAVLFGAVQALAQHGQHGSHATMSTGELQKMIDDMNPRADDPPSSKGYKEAHMQMMRAMHVPLTGNSDVDFVAGMIPHHQGAIDMAKVQIANGKDAELIRLARKIIEDQEREIGEMRAWLKRNGH